MSARIYFDLSLVADHLHRLLTSVFSFLTPSISMTMIMPIPIINMELFTSIGKHIDFAIVVLLTFLTLVALVTLALPVRSSSTIILTRLPPPKRFARAPNPIPSSPSFPSLSRPDVASAIHTLDSISIARSTVVNAFSDMTISSSPSSFSPSRPRSAKKVQVSQPIPSTSTRRSCNRVDSTNLSLSPACVNNAVDPTLELAFASLSLKPSVRSILKSCVKSGPSCLPKKVHFTHPHMTVTRVILFEVAHAMKIGPGRSYRRKRHVPHTEPRREYRKVAGKMYDMARTDGEYAEPFRPGLYGPNLTHRHIVRFCTDEHGVRRRCCDPRSPVEWPDD